MSDITEDPPEVPPITDDGGTPPTIEPDDPDTDVIPPGNEVIEGDAGTGIPIDVDNPDIVEPTAPDETSEETPTDPIENEPDPVTEEIISPVRREILSLTRQVYDNSLDVIRWPLGTATLKGLQDGIAAFEADGILPEILFVHGNGVSSFLQIFVDNDDYSFVERDTLGYTLYGHLGSLVIGEDVIEILTDYNDSELAWYMKEPVFVSGAPAEDLVSRVLATAPVL